ncbi:hypothetical protein [Nonomuraea sp. SYSU D8015]|uniref:hypothetical protein n=1 Tax=Nonomuraea sp. SYSU D8015 TaxID=2593644 RepID=UPI001660271D|nr:hypothetical protein [Nonomuraea sp. SYSU D8015]
MADGRDQRPSFESRSPTTPFRKVVLPAEETIKIPKPPKPGPSVPVRPQGQQPPAQEAPAQQPPGQQPPGQSSRQQSPAQAPVPPPVQPPMPPLPVVPPKPSRGIGDIPIKVVYLLGAILATVGAVVLVFVVFSGDVPANNEPSEQVVRVAPVPSASATPTATVSPTPTETPIVLPPVPESKAFKNLSGTASAVTSTITDNAVGITYPRLASPWKARSFSPYSIAQRIGKVKTPFTVIGSAMLPESYAPTTKPDSNADYREIATNAVRWSIRTQFPEGATVAEWTASKKIPVGKGWTLGYKVTYPNGGKQETAQAMVTIVEVGKNRPAMLVASIPESNKSRWRDLNTLAQQVRPI